MLNTAADLCPDCFHHRHCVQPASMQYAEAQLLDSHPCFDESSCLQGSFQKLVKSLQSLDYSILDVNSHRWHDDYNKFKAGVKDLEVMFTNGIQLAFDNASSLVGRVELLEVSQSNLSCACLSVELRLSACLCDIS